jgi:tricorn protease
MSPGFSGIEETAMRRLIVLTAAVFLCLARVSLAQPEARLLRFPTIHGDTIVFTYAGNLYAVAASGGVARRLTGHDGFEMFARFSPDGKHLAFTGQYDGNTEVYLMPAGGGVPRRLTYTATLGRDDVSDRMGPNNIVLGWKHDGKHILFRSRMRSFNDFLGQLFLVSSDGGLPEQVPLPRGGFASYSPDDTKFAYNRVFREFRTWKRYRGGMADEIWIHDFQTKKTEKITDTPASDIIPMWHGDRIYFLSDRGTAKRMNLYVYDTKQKTTQPVTDFKEFDIKFPSLGDRAIVFENGGYLYTLDLATHRVQKVTVRIQEDLVTGRGGLRDVSKNIASYEIGPDGKRALFVARGDAFTVPAQHGPTRNLTGTTGVHERSAVWSPDGKWIALISDTTGEDEIHVMPADGSDVARAVTSGADTYKYEIRWSPDSKKLLWGDKKLRLQFVDVATKKVTVVDQAKAWEIREHAWSPDSKWIAYARRETDALAKIWLYSVDQNKSWEVTDGWHDSSSPVFSGDGKYLFFVSNRDFNPIYSQTEWNHAYRDMARIYLVTLAKETPSPFQPKSDEVDAAAPAAPPAKEAGPIKVDTDGLKDRTLGLPITPASYRNLQSVGSTVYYIRQGSRDAGAQLLLYDLAGPKETALGAADGYEISGDGKKMLVSRGGQYGIIDLPRGPITLGETLNLSGLQVKLDRQAEWQQIFAECWRQERDFFYDPGLHSVDWKAVRARYEPLVAHVQHRADLTYIIGEMIGELNAGHTYVGGGDLPQVPRVQTGLLGAELKRDAGTRYYQILRILKGANWSPELRAPLTEIGIDVKEKDYIVAIDGRPTNEVDNIYELLVNTAGKQVTLKVNGKPEAKGARTVVVTPVADESKLSYHDWVQGNIKKVSDATGGKVGYLHVPDMLATGLNEFVKYYYPQLTRKGLIIDVRGNGGGNVSPMLIERLRREVAMIAIARNTAPTVNPSETFYGPMVCLMNEFSASDGDLFPFRFRYHKLGPLIGKRSWGGVIGIRGTLPIVDGGYLNRPEFSRYDVQGKEWIIEGHGVDPDIVIDNDPAREYDGIDDQLNKGIEVILEKLKTEEKKIPPPPPYPKR